MAKKSAFSIFQTSPGVMDLFSRRIIAWSLSKTLDASLVVDAVNLAKAGRNVLSPPILHSGRGSQYASAAYREASAGFRLRNL